MNDSELSTAVRESVGDIHSATPVAQIISRGRAVRARRRIPGVAGALTVVAGTALAATTLLPSGHPGSHPTSVRLAAWTVAMQANGDIDITINQLLNPAGLQSTLRADGLPVNVAFSGRSPTASCQPYPASRDVLSSVAHFNIRDGSAALVINPSALPAGTGVDIFDQPTAGVPAPSSRPGSERHDEGSGNTLIKLAVGLVYASQQCTGS